ncbi:MAG: 5-(carboxyamino)imidazole ribonucleotide mutase [Holophagaceae bacterium]|nr:5-(carboxyamino)imidazole ribonucleotide mutase [Holophagaceae bacterium]
MGTKPVVGIVMGSRSDWETMRPAADCLEALQVPFEALVMSAHRTPDKVFQYCVDAEANGLRVIIAGAGGAAALAGMMAAKTHLPVLGVPMPTKALNGLDSLLSIVQMPAGIPVGALAIGKPGATNAALLAASILSLNDATLRGRLLAYREAQTQAVLANDKLS